MKKTILIVSLFVLSVPFLASANGLVPCGGADDPCTLCDFFVLINNVIKFVMIQLVPPLAVLMILIGGVMYFMGGISSTMLSQAKSTFTAVVIGLLIVYTAWILVNTIMTRSGIVEQTGSAWWQIECESDSDPWAGVDNGYISNGNNGAGKWDKEKEVAGEGSECDVEDSLYCDTGEKAESGKCDAGENTQTTESRKTDDGKGWYCKFTGNVKPAPGYIDCYTPTGKISVSCEEDEDFKGITCPENLEDHPHIGEEYLKVRLLRVEGGTYPEKRCPIGYKKTQWQECDAAKPINDICPYDPTSKWVETSMACCVKTEEEETIDDIPDGTLLEHDQAAKFLQDGGINMPYDICKTSACDDPLNCTCLEGLPSQAVKKLIDINEDCEDCYLTITRGTEILNSQTTEHGKGEPVIDLRENPALEEWIEENSAGPGSGADWCTNEAGANNSHLATLPDGSTAEFCRHDVGYGDHWHINFK
jgi:hypothetical protein